jgi:hypothetical protein
MSALTPRRVMGLAKDQISAQLFKRAFIVL